MNKKLGKIAKEQVESWLKHHNLKNASAKVRVDQHGQYIEVRNAGLTQLPDEVSVGNGKTMRVMKIQIV